MRHDYLLVLSGNDCIEEIAIQIRHIALAVADLTRDQFRMLRNRAPSAGLRFIADKRSLPPKPAAWKRQGLNGKRLSTATTPRTARNSNSADVDVDLRVSPRPVSASLLETRGTLKRDASLGGDGYFLCQSLGAVNHRCMLEQSEICTKPVSDLFNKSCPSRLCPPSATSPPTRTSGSLPQVDFRSGIIVSAIPHALSDQCQYLKDAAIGAIGPGTTPPVQTASPVAASAATGPTSRTAKGYRAEFNDKNTTTSIPPLHLTPLHRNWPTGNVHGRPTDVVSTTPLPFGSSAGGVTGASSGTMLLQSDSIAGSTEVVRRSNAMWKPTVKANVGNFVKSPACGYAPITVQRASYSPMTHSVTQSVTQSANPETPGIPSIKRVSWSDPDRVSSPRQLALASHFADSVRSADSRSGGRAPGSDWDATALQTASAESRSHGSAPRDSLSQSGSQYTFHSSLIRTNRSNTTTSGTVSAQETGPAVCTPRGAYTRQVDTSFAPNEQSMVDEGKRLAKLANCPVVDDAPLPSSVNELLRRLELHDGSSEDSDDTSTVVSVWSPRESPYPTPRLADKNFPVQTPSNVRTPRLTMRANRAPRSLANGISTNDSSIAPGSITGMWTSPDTRDVQLLMLGASLVRPALIRPGQRTPPSGTAPLHPASSMPAISLGVSGTYGTTHRTASAP